MQKSSKQRRTFAVLSAPLIGSLIVGSLIGGCGGGGSGPAVPTPAPTTAPTAAPIVLGRIFYTSGSRDFSEPRDIYFTDALGNARVRITSNGAINRDVAVSRDGRKIVWVSIQNGVARLRVANSDGSGERVLNLPGLSVLQPALSADGSRIVFVGAAPNQNQGLYLVNSDGSNLSARLPTTGIALTENPGFDPTGRRIVFSALVPRTPPTGGSSGGGGPIGPISIHVINTDGSNLKRLTTTFTNDVNPDWSPDGRKIVFDSGLGVGGSGGIEVINADGTNRVLLSPRQGIDGQPTWSPDGRRIAFLSLGDGNSTDIFRMNADGSGRTNLTTDAPHDDGPSWGR